MPILLLLFQYRKYVIIVVAVIALIALALHLRRTLINEGEQQELTKIEEANHASQQKADKGSQSIDDCLASGHRWNRDDSLCERASPGP